MIGSLITWALGGGIEKITGQIADWDLKRREAKNDQDRIRAETYIANLEAQRSVLMEEQKHAATRWVRPALAFPVIVYWWKLIIFDTLLGWGSTPYPGDHVAWFVTLIPTAYFLARPFEKWRR